MREKATSRRKRPEREPESEGVGGLRNRWAGGGGGERWMGKGGGGGLRGGCQELVSKVGLHWDSWRGDGHINSSLPLGNIAFFFLFLISRSAHRGADIYSISAHSGVFLHCLKMCSEV